MSTTPTHTEFIWTCAGRPDPKWALEPAAGVCANCGAELSAGVHVDTVNTATFANHAEFMRFSDHVCPACAWLFSYPKSNHRNLLAVGDQLWWPMIGLRSATAERPQWLQLLSSVAGLDSATWLCGVLTTDPKPRYWPWTRLATVGAAGLYVHAPRYNQSGYRSFSLGRLLEVAAAICEVLDAGFSKQRCRWGLFGDYRRCRRLGQQAWDWEQQLRAMRREPEFTPALVMAQKGAL